jgi:hypothetical protein
VYASNMKYIGGQGKASECNDGILLCNDAMYSVHCVNSRLVFTQ